jgi:topoisomerase-4 subunit A
VNEDITKPEQDGPEVPREEITYLSGMYQNWFLDYASYVILERAVPYVNDGLKPVQRRILHTMREMDDGRYNKVANIVGRTMAYHPHGDASIYGALVTLGQKELLIDTQGNWGNTFTGDPAAAQRYIEARLSKFALEVVFNPKVTVWKLSYDGRNREPVTLPVKFPLLLAQGVEGIAVGLASKILPHNFNELLDASVAYLKGDPFELFPDFPTGGAIDVSRYNDGLRGGVVKVRAKIEKYDPKTLVITELPFGQTTDSLKESIVKANERGKIKIKKIDDNTADKVEIQVHLAPGISSDNTIDALYAFTDCEVSISPNACIIENDKPYFITVSDILRKSTDQTVELLRQELEIRRGELLEALLYASLEKIFIEERIYKDKEFEESETVDLAIAHIDRRIEPWKPSFVRPIVRDDLLRLLEIKMARILKFNSKKAEENIAALNREIEQIKHHLEHIVQYAIDYFERIKEKYGANRHRRTEIRNFDNIVAAKVAVANSKLYIDREEGFMGIALKKTQAEYVCDCSDMDDIIVVRKDGTVVVTKVEDKKFIGKNIEYISVFNRNDKRTIYNMVYRDGRLGAFYMKRFAMTGLTRDKEYNITQGKDGTKIWYFSVNPNGEAETLKVTLKPRLRLKKTVFDVNFGDLAIKGRNAMGNILTKYDVHRIVLKEKGLSTLGGLDIWFDPDVLRLNADKRGDYLGEFQGNDRILVVSKTGDYQLYSFDLANHFDADILTITKFIPHKIVSVAYFDSEQELIYIKRFEIEELGGRRVNFIGDNPKNRLILISWHDYPQLEITFGGRYAGRPAETVNVADFIGVKSYKAKGKRLSQYDIDAVTELDPLLPDAEPDAPATPPTDPQDEIPFDIETPQPDDDNDDDANQMTLF